MKNITSTLSELFLMLMWGTCLWYLWKLNMVLLMLIIIHFMVNTLSNFLHLHVPFKQTWGLMVKLFLLVKWYVKELIVFPINIIFSFLCFTKTKSINTILSLRTKISGNVNLFCYDSKDVILPSFRSISQNDYNTLSPLHIPMKIYII